MSAKQSTSRTGLVGIRDVEKFLRLMAIAQSCFLLPQEMQETSRELSGAFLLYFGRVHILP